MEDTYRYRGWLVSDSFWKRALGVFGYGLVAQLIIGAVLALVFIIPAMMAAFVFGMGSGV
jgi:hypothetical protein